MTPWYPCLNHCVAARCVLCSSILPCSSSPIHIDGRTLCEAAGSLKKLKLQVDGSCTSQALAKVFDHRSLEDLEFSIINAVNVSSACSPGIWLRCVDSEGAVYMNPLFLFLLFVLLLSTLELFGCITCAVLLPL